MNSLKRLPVTALLRKKALGHTRVNSLENVGFNNLHQVRNLTILKKEYRNFQCMGRRFYADLKKMEQKPKEEVTEDIMNFEYEADEADEADEAGEADETDETDETDEESTEQIFQELAAGDPEKLQKLKLLEFELAVLREEQHRVPTKLSRKQWLELCEIRSYSGRRKFLDFLHLNELKSAQSVQKSLRKRQIYDMYKKELGFHYYGLSGHTMFMRVYDKNINRLLNHRLLTPKLDVLLDCSYQRYMSPTNTKACAKQILYCFNLIKIHRCTASLKLCNFNKDDYFGKILDRYIPGVYEHHGDDLYKESYLEMYPRDKLVYLTPHTRQKLKTLDPELVYIIGAFVDKGSTEKASLAKAKENKIRMASFPIDEYLLWKQGTKSLPLNMALNILLDQAYYCDWYKSFRSLPQRCIEGNMYSN